MFRKQFIDVRDACALAQGIVDTLQSIFFRLYRDDLRLVASSQHFQKVVSDLCFTDPSSVRHSWNLTIGAQVSRREQTRE
jgi:hypothetical protein